MKKETRDKIIDSIIGALFIIMAGYGFFSFLQDLIYKFSGIWI